MSPQAAWQAAEKAEAPRPTGLRLVHPAAPRPQPVPAPTDLPDGTYITDRDKLTVVDLASEILIEHTRPATGITYVGNGRPPPPTPQDRRTVTEVLRHQPSPKS